MTDEKTTEDLLNEVPIRLRTAIRWAAEALSLAEATAWQGDDSETVRFATTTIDRIDEMERELSIAKATMFCARQQCVRRRYDLEERS